MVTLKSPRKSRFGHFSSLRNDELTLRRKSPEFAPKRYMLYRTLRIGERIYGWIKAKISSNEMADSILLACSDLSDFGGFSGRFREHGFLAELESILRPAKKEARIDQK